MNEEAIRLATKPIQSENLSKSGAAVAYSDRGLALDDLREFDKAIADYTTAIRLAPRDALFFSNRGFSHANKRDYALAIRDYDRAIEIDPSDTQAYRNRAEAWLARGDAYKAIAD